ncbi:hypothetical protein [Leptospira interrogans]|nr:hypothetical protein [Leptospira interrogans]EKN88931.1 hypothetical protein LEP1GSC027_4224 [Leptospira interrogans str. 2002000624]EKQ47593.1 hypothetical protein LEP1GSC026_4651 [Leptospira interrogans str. 2002000623]EMJ67743.1 hypothetical protein LEP1GSC033_3336 [Leptospira interrogans str. 2002000632]MCL8310110.1 hypothetical protein [Leptospira interrogans]UNE66908.1 hypothetical protein FH588_20765 [Leptospira interrogans]
MKEWRDGLITKTKTPKFCPKCEMRLILVGRVNVPKLGTQPLEYGCHLKCESCRFEGAWINENFNQEIADSFGIEGAREFVGKYGWFGEKEKLFLLQESDTQLELFDFNEDTI